MILSIDPGIHGALALYDGQSLTVVDMPVYEKPAGQRRNMRKFIDEPKLVSMVQHAGMTCDWLILEQVNGIPGQAAHSAFMFGRGVGVIMGAAHGIGLPVEEVHSATWKGALGVPADKKKAVLRATELLPAWAPIWTVQHSHCTQEQASGRAEAGMLALYGHMTKGALS